MRPTLRVLTLAIFSVLLGRLSLAASYNTVHVWESASSSNALNFDNLAYSETTHDLIITGNAGFYDRIIAFSSWTTEGIGSTSMVQIKPTGYKNCSSFRPGFLKDSEYQDYRYLTFLCVPNQGGFSDLFVVRLNSDGTMDQYVIFSSAGGNNSSTPQFAPTAFLESTIVLPLLFGTYQFVVLTGDLQVKYQISPSVPVTTTSIAPLDQPDSFAIGGASYSNGAIITVDANGTITKQIQFPNGSIVESVGASEGVIHACVSNVFNRTIESILVKADDLTIINSTEDYFNNTGLMICLASSGTYTYTKTYEQQSWIFDTQGQSGSFTESEFSVEGSETSLIHSTSILVDDGSYLLEVGATHGSIIAGFVAINLSNSGNGTQFSPAPSAFELLQAPSTSDLAATWQKSNQVTGAKITRGNTNFISDVNFDTQGINVLNPPSTYMDFLN
mmetsp:Transcript_29763/g.33843  ORF Transcript_29763/g.33843 Transcript_29763/m.33843 type:complete len:445 (+) Transcript_29763:42-1376(+)